MNDKFDILIIGGGIVGLASALQIQRRRPEHRILILEKEPSVAMHQSSRNSGVIHSGIYYRPDSLRARNCRRGYELLLQFCRVEQIPYDICGKIIVAVEEHERPRLQQILERGRANGLEGVRLISGAEVRELEPHVQALEAVWVPQAGIVDYGTVARRYADLLLKNGAVIRTGMQVTRIETAGSGEVRVHTPDETFRSAMLVNCAGLYADKIARMAGVEPGVQILPFRGEFYELAPERQQLVRNLIYPTPNPNFPFLGVHFTRMIGGGIEAGPNAVLAFRREGYHKTDIHIGELTETLLFPGFRRIARKYWRDGLLEFQRSFSKHHFLKALQRLVPDIRSEDIHPGRSGVRAMACSPNGELLDDFLILQRPNMLHVINAPSPAATASLAVGETVAVRLLGG